MSNLSQIDRAAQKRAEKQLQDAERSAVPPHDIDAEGAVLEAILSNGAAAFDRVANKLLAEHFYAEPNRRIYEAAQFVRESGQPVDVVTVVGRLRATNRLEQVGGSSYVAGLLNLASGFSNIEAHSRIIRDRYRLRMLITRCRELAAKGYNEESADAFADEVREKLEDILRESSDRSGRMIGKDIDAIYHQLAGRGAGILGRGLPTGFQQIDDLTTGLHAAEVTYIAARPGMGKTSFALCMARNIARLGVEEDPPSMRKVVAFYSIEQPREQILMRLACIDGTIDAQRMRKLELTDLEWQYFCASCAMLRNLPIHLDDAPLTSARLRTDLLKVKAEAEAEGKELAACFIDYIQLMKGEGDENEVITKNSAALKEISKEIKIPIVALCQLNRGVEKQQDKRPGLSDLRGSGSLEQDADNILFIYRDDYYRQRFEEPDGEAEIIIGKQRNGPSPATVTVKFYAACTRFENA